MARTVMGVGINDANYKVKPVVNGSRVYCPFYVTWCSMIRRCYSDKYKRLKPTYEGAEVCEEWLRFSNFKSWMENQDWKGMELDKDIIKPGNKVYSPDNCVFVSKDINMLLHTHTRKESGLLRGVSKSSKVGFIAQVNSGERKYYLGTFNNEIDAYKAYVKKKVEILVDTSKSVTDQRVKNGLLNHAYELSNYKGLECE